MRRPLRALAVFSGSMLLAGSAAAQATHPNILMVIADDLGVEMIEAYNGRHLAPYTTAPHSHSHTQGSGGHPHTPTISDLAADGIMFLNAWSNPLCGVTRATIQTGRYGHRTGVLGAGGVLPAGLVMIPELLAEAAASTQSTADDYKSAIVGKWGFYAGGDEAEDAKQPVKYGYDKFAGAPGPQLFPNDYFGWRKYVGTYEPESPECQDPGPVSHQNADCIGFSVDPPNQPTLDYATIANVDDAKAWLETNAGHPWFLMLSFNAPHQTYHAPPRIVDEDRVLHDVTSFDPAGGPCPSGQTTLCYRAMIEAMDTEIGRMLTYIEQELDELDQTIVIFVGDNGSPGNAGVLNSQRSKGTLFQGGVNVPLIVKGPGVDSSGVPGQPRVSEALVNASDLFMTVLKLARIDTAAISVDHDSYSIVPILTGATDAIRHFAYAELSGTNRDGKAIRNRAGLKLQRSEEGVPPSVSLKWFLFDLKVDPHEQINLVDPNSQTGPDLVAEDPDPALEAQLEQLEYLLGADNSPPNIPAANPDEDADGLGNASDNCRELPQGEEQRCDTDADGYGNLCDGDFDNDGFTIPADFDIWNVDYTTTGLDGGAGTDMNCDGFVDSSDFSHWVDQFQGAGIPGPSGLACAGTEPCPVP